MVTKNKRRFIVQLVIFICFYVCSYSSYSQSIQTFIDRKDILIGEQIHYTLQFTLPSNAYSIEFNVPDSFAHFEIMNKAKSDSTTKEGAYMVMQRILVTSWDSGRWAIPSFPVRLRNTVDNSSYILNTDSVLVNVGYAKADSTDQLRDIKPVMEVFYVDETWIFIAAGVLAGLILLYFLYRYLRKRALRPKPALESALSPYDEAMQSLKNISQLNLQDPTAVKTYHSSLAEIFKRYYSRKLQKNILNKTTDEVLMQLNQGETNTQTISHIAEALRCGDAVKFAKFVPPVTQSGQSFQNIHNSIEQLEKDLSTKNKV